jgi:hypothetical protein
MVCNTLARWNMSTERTAEVDTLKAATRFLPCVDISCLETLDRPKHVKYSWINALSVVKTT